MGNRIDKGKRNYNYSGTPKSYWNFAKKRNPVGKHETDEMKARREARSKEYDQVFQSVLKARSAERKEKRRKGIK